MCKNVHSRRHFEVVFSFFPENWFLLVYTYYELVCILGTQKRNIVYLPCKHTTLQQRRYNVAATSTQQTQNVATTSLQRRCNMQRRCNDVATCVCWVDVVTTLLQRLCVCWVAQEELDLFILFLSKGITLVSCTAFLSWHAMFVLFSYLIGALIQDSFTNSVNPDEMALLSWIYTVDTVCHSVLYLPLLPIWQQ